MFPIPSSVSFSSSLIQSFLTIKIVKTSTTKKDPRGRLTAINSFFANLVHRPVRRPSSQPSPHYVGFSVINTESRLFNFIHTFFIESTTHLAVILTDHLIVILYSTTSFSQHSSSLGPYSAPKRFHLFILPPPRVLHRPIHNYNHFYQRSHFSKKKKCRSAIT